MNHTTAATAGFHDGLKPPNPLSDTIGRIEYLAAAIEQSIYELNARLYGDDPPPAVPASGADAPSTVPMAPRAEETRLRLERAADALTVLLNQL